MISGQHVCGVALSVDLRDSLAAAWIQDGLTAGAQVCWTEPPGGFVSRLTAAPDSSFGAALADGRLTILDVDDVVGLSSAAEIPARLEQALQRARAAVAAGFTGLTIGIDISDALTVMPDVETQLRFEAAWEQLTRRHPLSLLCLYGPEVEQSHRDGGIAAHPRELADAFATARIIGDAIAISGEIDAGNAGMFQEYLLAAVRDLPGAQVVVIDLGNLSFIDVAGARMLVQVKSTLAPRGIHVVNPPRMLTRMLELLRWELDVSLREAGAR